jgi:hypothetical protein
MKEAPRSSETSVLTRATRRNNPDDIILHSHRRENLKSYNAITVFISSEKGDSLSNLLTMVKKIYPKCHIYLLQIEGEWIFKITALFRILTLTTNLTKSSVSYDITQGGSTERASCCRLLNAGFLLGNS